VGGLVVIKQWAMIRAAARRWTVGLYSPYIAENNKIQGPLNNDYAKGEADEKPGWLV
jgi:hypothetical protein